MRVAVEVTVGRLVSALRGLARDMADDVEAGLRERRPVRALHDEENDDEPRRR